MPQNEIEKMISAEQVASIVDKAVSELEYSESKSRTSDYSTFGYEWKPEKERIMEMTMSVGERTVTTKIPLPNQVDIGNIEIIEPKNGSAEDYFKRIYGPKTKEQKERAKEAVDRAAKSNDEVDEKSAETIKNMVDKEVPNQEIAGIGDVAYWAENNTKGMIYVVTRVLHGNTMFKITTDVSEDTQEDLRVSKEITKQIIANCVQ